MKVNTIGQKQSFGIVPRARKVEVGNYVNTFLHKSGLTTKNANFEKYGALTLIAGGSGALLSDIWTSAKPTYALDLFCAVFVIGPLVKEMKLLHAFATTVAQRNKLGQFLREKGCNSEERVLGVKKYLNRAGIPLFSSINKETVNLLAKVE